MIKEALEQSGIAGLIGWTDTNEEQDSLFQRALVSNTFINDDMTDPPRRQLYTPSSS